MDKKMAGLLGAAAALTAITGAQAAPALQTGPAAPVNYKDLLQPIPNALALLKADDRARVQGAPSAKLERVQYHHHHHHHHHHGYGPGGIVGGIIGGVIGGALAPRCYWTWSRPFWNGYRWVRSRVQVCR